MHALVAFEAAARNRSFTKAARELCITHGAVSHRIRAVEVCLGSAVFHRDRRGARLTAKGEELLGAVSRALVLLEGVCFPSATVPGKIRVSVTPAFASNWLLGRLPEFGESHPNVSVEIHSSYDLVDFRLQDIDIAIRYGKGSWPGLYCTKLRTDWLFPVCSPHYLRLIGGIDEPRDLVKASLLRSHRELWSPWLNAADLDCVEPRTATVFDDYNLLIQAAVLGHGVALARSTLVEGALRAGELVKLFDVAVASEHAYFLVCPEAHLQRVGVLAFAEWIRAALEVSGDAAVRVSAERVVAANL